MKKKILGLLLILVMVTGCGKIPTLSNGKDAVVTFNNGDMISVDDLYAKVKDTYALSSLVTMIDTYTLEKTFPDFVDDSEEYAKKFIDTTRENYDTEEAFLKDIRNYTGMATVEAYQNYIYLSYMQSHAMEEYSKTLITDKEIEKYYKTDVVGDIEVYHILITPEVTDKMTDDETKKAEEAAKTKAEGILKDILKADDVKEAFKEAAKKYSKDEATAPSGGPIGQINKDTLGSKYQAMVDAAYSIKDGAVYDKVVKTELGYHLVYRNTSYDKKSLEDSKESIIKALSNKKIDADDTMAVKSLQYYRKALGVEIQDSELKTQYGYYMQNLLNGNANSNTTN